MLNNTILVGRITNIFKDDNHKEITIAVNRNFKNIDGVYDTDYINITLFNAVDVSLLTIGQIIGVKGRIEGTTSEDTTSNILRIIAEKITMLSSKKYQ